MQTNNPSKIYKQLLHLRGNGVKWVKLADGTYVGKGKCGCAIEIRFTSFATSVCKMQPIPRWARGAVLQKNVTNRGRGIHRKTGKRPTSTSQGIRPLRKSSAPVPVNPRRTRKNAL